MQVDLPVLGHTLSFSLANFEGPLELLLYLIQKEEIDLFDIPLRELTSQFFNELDEIKSVDVGGDFVWNSSRLLLLKSRRLLPQEESEQELEPDFRVEIMQKLVEYAHLKEVARELSHREESGAHFVRSPQLPEKKIGTGLEEVTLDELGTLLHDLLKKAESRSKNIEIGEKWEVAPKMEWFLEQLPIRKKILFAEIFSAERVKEEIIVFFLAMLELMKLQKVKLVKDDANYWITYA